MRSVGSTCTPMGATSPLTLTQPWAIQSSASRREHRPSSAMRLFRREVAMPVARLPACSASRRERTGAAGGPAPQTRRTPCGSWVAQGLLRAAPVRGPARARRKPGGWPWPPPRAATPGGRRAQLRLDHSAGRQKQRQGQLADGNGKKTWRVFSPVEPDGPMKISQRCQKPIRAVKLPPGGLARPESLRRQGPR
jgi:hypothetical protein